MLTGGCEAALLMRAARFERIARRRASLPLRGDKARRHRDRAADDALMACCEARLPPAPAASPPGSTSSRCSRQAWYQRVAGTRGAAPAELGVLQAASRSRTRRPSRARLLATVQQAIDEQLTAPADHPRRARHAQRRPDRHPRQAPPENDSRSALQDSSRLGAEAPGPNSRRAGLPLVQRIAGEQ